jgi:diaminopimelate decarboxylase
LGCTLTDQTFRIAAAIINKYEIDLDYLDIGSGFATEWPKPKGRDKWSVPPITEYAKVVERLHRKWTPNIRRIIIEPGKRLVASSASFVTKVVKIVTRGDVQFIMCDGALNFILGAEKNNYRISLVDSGDSKRIEQSYKSLQLVLCGCLCDSLDIIDSKFKLSRLKTNDLIKIDDVGAYDIARSFVWQLPSPPIIWASQGEFCVINNYLNQ